MALQKSLRNITFYLTLYTLITLIFLNLQELILDKSSYSMIKIVLIKASNK